VRIGVFGGTFDPPHRAHVWLATLARDRLALDLVEVVPGASPPHRAHPSADGFDRFAMVALACRDEPQLLASPRELRRGGTSFTVDTLREIAAERPGAELFLVLGEDSYHDLPGWREPEEICRLARLVVVPRRPAPQRRVAACGEAAERASGCGEEPAASRRGLRDRDTVWVDAPPMDVSARGLRERLRSGEPRLEELDPAVERYIRQRGLYGAR
jgi:nicotinate-nucleotide adenylyltransferase